jgi:cis-3-alkyl-4-acyloxetan-2-one decarboxylase
MAYLDAGSGPPVVMVHGNPTWSYYYRSVVLALKDRFRCIVPDHIGCGMSSKPSVESYDYSLKSRIDNLESLLESLNLTEPITLIVHDWGGMIGMGYAVRHPERIGRIIAINTGCTSLPPGKRLPWLLKLGRNSKVGSWLILQQNAFCRLAAKWCVTRRPLPASVRNSYLQPYDTPANRIAVLKFVQTIPLAPSDPGWDIVKHVEANLHRLAHLPTLLLWGLKDFVFDHHFLSAWQQHFPAAQSFTWPDCGHYLLEDAPEEAIGRITEFMKTVKTIE